MRFNVSEDGFVEYANKLERISDKALPNAIKNTLNSLAFSMKGSKSVSGEPLIQQTTAEAFNKRNRGFFKVTSSVQTAKGNEINRMQSAVGFTDKRLKANTDAVSNLSSQESGGAIGPKPFVALGSARVGKQYGKQVRKRSRLSNIDEVINARDSKGANDAERFIKAAITAGKGGHVLGTEDAEGRRYLLRINSVKQKTGGTVVNSTALYVYEEGRRFSVSSTGFMRQATDRAIKKAKGLFKANAERTLKKFK